MKVEVFYDKECPFCRKYAQFIKLKEKNELILINARENIKKVDDLRNKGFDINEGFVIRVDSNNLYQGADAIVFLNNLSKNKILFANTFLFKFIIYPLIKFLRIMVLFILMKELKIK